MTGSGGRAGWWFWGILTLALALRVVAAVLVQQHVSRTPGRLCVIAGDAEGYWELSRNLAHGRNFEIYQPPRRVLRMPGFPAILAVSSALFGERVGVARLVLAVIGTLACGGVYWLGSELYGRSIGLIAAGLAAISPTFVAASVMILSETTFACGLLLSLITHVWLVRGVESGASSTRIMTLGILSGLAATVACYIRPSWLLFPLMSMGWLVLSALKSRPIAISAVFRNACSSTTSPHSAELRLPNVMLASIAVLLGMILGLAPWTYRNYVVTGGHFVPTTLWMGPSLYDGLNPLANGDSHMEFLEQDALYQTQSEYAVDRHYRQAAWTWSAQNPGRVLELAWVKLVRFWNLWPNSPQFDHWMIKAALLTFFVPMFGLSAWGMWCGRGSIPASSISWSWVLILTLGPILYFSGLHTLFVSSLRYRLPAEYPLLILTAIGLRDVARRVFATRSR